MLTLVLWQHVVCLCVSCTLFRMSLIMVVRSMLCSVRLADRQTAYNSHTKTRYAATAPKLT